MNGAKQVGNCKDMDGAMDALTDSLTGTEIKKDSLAGD